MYDEPLMRLACRVWLLCAAATAAAAPKPSAPPASLEDPCIEEGAACTRHALDGFRRALAAQREGKAAHPLRISYFGDSLTADDHITHALRTKLQAQLGDGGPGFVFALSPHPYCQHQAVSRVVGGDWASFGISTIVPGDHLLGLGGTAEGEGVIRFIPAARTIHTVDVHYLAQPRGGSFEIVADGAVLSRVETGGEHKQSGFAGVVVPDGTRRIELRAQGRVRLFGASLEAARGAVVDNLGVVNATAKAMHEHNFAEHWQNQLAHRDADLVIVMFGTNEAEWLRPRGAGMDEHERLFGDLLATIRKASPQASCLVVSPLDQLDWRDERMPPRDSIPAMVAAQRRAAQAHGCAFWDVYRWMGGRGASRGWYRRGLVVKDFQHPTSEGAELLADALFAGLVGEPGAPPP
jgi:lysophospholipase L1-like esterase